MSSKSPVKPVSVITGKLATSASPDAPAEATFHQLRDMPDPPATFVSVDVCEIAGHA